MLFNSLTFAYFFIFVFIFYALLKSTYRVPLLLIASCIFYSYFVPIYLLILFTVIIVDYVAGIAIYNSAGKKKKIILILSLFANLGILFFFKYYNFFLINTEGLFNYFGLNTDKLFLHILLPIGLSFHVFQSLSYTIEVYLGRQKAERNFLIYSLYVLYFPQLVAGPIERPQNLLQQFKKLEGFKYENVTSGLKLMAVGLIKKCVIADNLTLLVDSVYLQPQNYGFVSLLIATIFFSFQIFCDFSGYSDVARGTSRFFGVELMVNFDKPYFARSFSEFWRRWHISLSTWFRDYVYIPLGGSRVTLAKICRNVLIVFLLSGLWHGASWNFVIWGFLHGIYFCIEHIFKPKKSLIMTYTLVLITWVFFRAATFDDALYIIFGGFIEPFKGFTTIPLYQIIEGFILIMLLVLFQVFDEKFNLIDLISKLPKTWRWCIYSTMVLVFIMFGQFTSKHFIYFQF